MRTAGEIAEDVRRGRLRPRAVAVEHLERIAALDPSLGAFQLVRAEDVLAEADALEERDDLHTLPLAGVPVAVKDDLDLAGTPTRQGSVATPDAPAAADSELVARVRAAGALLIGKTRVPELCLWPFTESQAFGVTRNPWHRGYSPGGSTGGGAAAVASGMAPLAVGSDGGGSLRIPASCCGLVGFKPGPGIVPQPHEEPHWVGLAEWGPLATTVDDAALLLDVLAGTDAYRSPRPPARPLRVALSERPPLAGVRVDREVRSALAATGRVLDAAGHRVVRTDPPYRAADSAAFLARFVAGAAGDTRELPEWALERRSRGAARTGRALHRVRGGIDPAPAHAVRGRFEEWFAGYDLLVTPTLATPALRIGEHAGRGFARTVLGLSGFMPYTPHWNLVGFPALSVPAGRSGRGLPIGVQLVAPRRGEALLLSVARQLEQRQPWPLRAPP